MLIEVCVESLEDAINAALNGADRLEVNSALALGGLTPSGGLVYSIINEVDIPVIAMIRPRMSGFSYSNYEFSTMLQDAINLANLGVAGFAVGFLNSNGYLDIDKLKTFRAETAGLQLVFHRAFDLIKNPLDALETLIELGIDRVLTSGGAVTALAGSDNIKQMIQNSQNRIEILPAAGINSDNLKDLIAQTECNQIHGTFSHVDTDSTSVNKTSLKFNDLSAVRDQQLKKLDIQLMRELVSHLS